MRSEDNWAKGRGGVGWLCEAVGGEGKRKGREKGSDGDKRRS